MANWQKYWSGEGPVDTLLMEAQKEEPWIKSHSCSPGSGSLTCQVISYKLHPKLMWKNEWAWECGFNYNIEKVIHNSLFIKYGLYTVISFQRTYYGNEERSNFTVQEFDKYHFSQAIKTKVNSKLFFPENRKCSITIYDVNLSKFCLLHFTCVSHTCSRADQSVNQICLIVDLQVYFSNYHYFESILKANA